jgi:hypothetical protein
MFRQQKYDLTQMLQNEAGKDPLIDRFSCGYIAAINDLLEAKPDEELE